MGSGGGSDQHFCLRWNNFHSNIATSFEQLRDHEDFVDVTLACEGRTIKAHKVVLSACSPYFRNLLKVIHCTQHHLIRSTTIKGITTFEPCLWCDIIQVRHCLKLFIYIMSFHYHFSF